jgi:pyruvate formate lyase activating enzyme
VNTGIEEITGLAEFVAGLQFLKKRGMETASPGKPQVNILPYHNIASGKYKKLEMFYDSDEMDEPTPEHLKTAAEIFGKFGIEVEIGG